MNRLENLLLMTVTLMMLWVGSAVVWESDAEAQLRFRRPYRHSYGIGVRHVSWGWFPVVGGNWYGIAVNPWQPYGYAYGPYYGNNIYYQSFGAIAYSPSTRRYGLSWGQPQRFNADYLAQNHCGIADCRTVVWVQGGCASISRSYLTEDVFWGLGQNRAMAERNAMQVCRNQSASAFSECESLAWVCSYR